MVLLCEISLNLVLLDFQFWCVGRGVLRFRDARYRKTRSKFNLFIDFCADSGKLGVDIIYYNRLGLGWVLGCYTYTGGGCGLLLLKG